MNRHPFLLFHIFLSGVFIIFLCFLEDYCHAQDVEPPIDNLPLVNELAPADETFSQFSIGFVSYGYEESVYYQFSGDEIFQDKKSFNSFAFNPTYEFVTPVANPTFTGYGFGFEWLQFTATTESLLGKKEYKTDMFTEIAMTMNIYMATARFYFVNPMRSRFVDPTFQEMLRIFFGVGWGVIAGTFSGTIQATATTTKRFFKTDFNGLTTYREIGLMLVGESMGLVSSIRLIQAPNVQTKNDPFERDAKDDEVNINMSGQGLALKYIIQF